MPTALKVSSHRLAVMHEFPRQRSNPDTTQVSECAHNLRALPTAPAWTSHWGCMAAELRKEKGSRSAKAATPGGAAYVAVHSLEANSCSYHASGPPTYLTPPAAAMFPASAAAVATSSDSLRESSHTSGQPIRPRGKSQSHLEVRGCDLHSACPQNAPSIRNVHAIRRSVRLTWNECNVGAPQAGIQ